MEQRTVALLSRGCGVRPLRGLAWFPIYRWDVHLPVAPANITRSHLTYGKLYRRMTARMAEVAKEISLGIAKGFQRHDRLARVTTRISLHSSSGPRRKSATLAWFRHGAAALIRRSFSRRNSNVYLSHWRHSAQLPLLQASILWVSAISSRSRGVLLCHAEAIPKVDSVEPAFTNIRSLSTCFRRHQVPLQLLAYCDDMPFVILMHGVGVWFASL